MIAVIRSIGVAELLPLHSLICCTSPDLNYAADFLGGDNGNLSKLAQVRFFDCCSQELNGLSSREDFGLRARQYRGVQAGYISSVDDFDCISVQIEKRGLWQRSWPV